MGISTVETLTSLLITSLEPPRTWTLAVLTCSSRLLLLGLAKFPVNGIAGS